MSALTGNGSRIERWITEMLATWRGNGNPARSPGHPTARETERKAVTRLYGERHDTVVISPPGEEDDAAEDIPPEDELPAGTA